MHNEPNLEALLDQALSAYSAQEPQLGLEARVLRNIRAPRPRRWLWIAVPALAALTLTILVQNQPQVRTHPEKQPLVTQVVPEATVPVEPVTPRKTVKRRSHSGPTSQQLALATLVRDYPELASALTHEVPEPLTVEPLTVEPISVNALDQ